jgi:hypothetical protein
LNNFLETAMSYLRMNSIISTKSKISRYQNAMALSLHELKLIFDESQITKLMRYTKKEIQKGKYVELRSNLLDSSIKRIIAKLNILDDQLKEFLLKKGFFNKIKNMLFNDSFGSLIQFKTDLTNRFACEEVKITTDDKIKLDA